MKKVNYESTASLKEALQGQDAVVSTTASAAVGNQVPIVDAAIAAGVKRFIPSEFGINTRTLTHPGLKTILGGKIKTFDYLIEKSKENPSFTYTGVSSSLFFDWVRRKRSLTIIPINPRPFLKLTHSTGPKIHRSRLQQSQQNL